MKIIEYRILMPLTVEENRIGQRFSFCECERTNTGGGEGVEIVQDQLFKVTKDASGRIQIPSLPNYEDTETQMANGATSNGSRLGRKASSSSLDKLSRAQAPPTFYEHLPPNGKRSDFGLYTHKIYKIDSKVPWFLRKIIPRDALMLHERAWNMYPDLTKTVVINEYLKSKSRLELDTVVLACPTGEPEENAHNLSADLLKKREIVHIDIADVIPPSYYKDEEDPAKFRSVKTKRGPLVKGEWVKHYKENRLPLICVYKLVTTELRVMGVQRIAENYCKHTYKELFHVFHRIVFCYIDKWHGMSEEDLRRIEEGMKERLGKQINEGELSQVQIQVVPESEQQFDAE
jgi:hypothetical protein